MQFIFVSFSLLLKGITFDDFGISDLGIMNINADLQRARAVLIYNCVWANQVVTKQARITTFGFPTWAPFSLSGSPISISCRVSHILNSREGAPLKIIYWGEVYTVHKFGKNNCG